MQRNRKNRSRKRKPAVRTGRRTAPPVLKSAAILVVAIIFILIIIPFTITMVFTSDSQEGTKKENRDPGAQPEETITDTAAVPKTIRVQREDSGKREKIEFEEYVKGVVASEMPSDFEEEALKAQAVAARTYSLAKVQNVKKKRKFLRPSKGARVRHRPLSGLSGQSPAEERERRGLDEVRLGKNIRGCRGYKGTAPLL